MAFSITKQTSFDKYNTGNKVTMPALIEPVLSLIIMISHDVLQKLFAKIISAVLLILVA
jgi:hypothetical protein